MMVRSISASAGLAARSAAQLGEGVGVERDAVRQALGPRPPTSEGQYPARAARGWTTAWPLVVQKLTWKTQVGLQLGT
jgi:hypothetical protein